MSAHLKSNLLYEPDFRWRAGEITRLEGFSDAVFAFAVTLLVVSLEVPHTFAELAGVMKGFVAFGICFAALVLVWKEHSLYFRRYGLQTPYVTFLNCVLLFLILFFVYPLKFLFSFLVGEFTGGRLAVYHSAEPQITQNQLPALMSMYGLGLAAVYLVFVLLYAYAYKLRSELELDELESYITKRGVWNHAVMMAIGLFSTLLANLLPSRVVGLSGMVYWVIPLYFSIAGSIMGKRQRLMREAQKKKAALKAAT
jgi:uncharacterized membrane protein